MKSTLPSLDGRTSGVDRGYEPGYRSFVMSRGTETSRGGTESSRGVDPARDTAAGGSRKGKKRVLVVDDEKDLVDLISYNLGRNGYEALTALNGNAAIEIATREQPDLIILDLMLPGLD